MTEEAKLEVMAAKYYSKRLETYSEEIPLKDEPELTPRTLPLEVSTGEEVQLVMAD